MVTLGYFCEMYKYKQICTNIKFKFLGLRISLPEAYNVQGRYNLAYLFLFKTKTQIRPGKKSWFWSLGGSILTRIKKIVGRKI